MLLGVKIYLSRCLVYLSVPGYNFLKRENTIVEIYEVRPPIFTGNGTSKRKDTNILQGSWDEGRILAIVQNNLEFRG